MPTHIFQYQNENKSLQKKTGGFSFPELIIAIGIFVMLTTITISGYSTLNHRVNVDTLAHNIGQWVRDAQISAMSVRQSVVTGVFPAGYGLHFETGASSTQFIYFRDIDPDGTGSGLPDKRYTVDIDGVPEQTITLLQGYFISSISGGTGWVDIVFTRPEPDAVITGSSGIFSPVRIVVSSPKGLQRAVVVYSTGQVSIQTP